MAFVFTYRRPIIKIEDKTRALRAYPTGHTHEDGKKEIKVEYEDIGWFVQLEGFTESICIAEHETLPNGGKRMAPKPDLEVGQIMCVTMRAEPKATT